MWYPLPFRGAYDKKLQGVCWQRYLWCYKFVQGRNSWKTTPLSCKRHPNVTISRIIFHHFLQLDRGRAHGIFYAGKSTENQANSAHTQILVWWKNWQQCDLHSFWKNGIIMHLINWTAYQMELHFFSWAKYTSNQHKMGLFIQNTSNLSIYDNNFQPIF